MQRDQVTVTIDPALRETVKEIAKEERRTLSAQICHFVAAGVAQRGAERQQRLLRPASEITVGR